MHSWIEPAWGTPSSNSTWVPIILLKAFHPLQVIFQFSFMVTQKLAWKDWVFEKKRFEQMNIKTCILQQPFRQFSQEHLLPYSDRSLKD